MLGDETQPAEGDGSRARAASGPRHAAPRKSLLTKLHMPAGKAVALAAMPTAVLMGMGFTPHLAQADELPKNPYLPGPCVTRSDTPSPSATGGGADRTDPPKPTTSPSATARPTPSDSPTAAAPSETDKPVVQPQSKAAPSTAPTAKATPRSTPQSTPQSTPSSTPKAAPKATPKATASAAPGAKKSVDPLDPLGIGALLTGILGGGKPTAAPTTQAPAPEPTATQAPEPDPATSPSATPPGGTPTSGAPAKDPDTGAGKAAGGSAKGAGDSATGTVKKTVKGLSDATTPPTAGPTTGPSGDATGSDDPGGKQAYPCPTYDAKALADATTEQGIPLLPDQPWVLKSSLLTLYGLKYDGIVKVRTYSGAIKDVLKFETTGVDIGDLHQIVDGPKDTKTTVTARAGSTSTIRGGKVTMYTESLSGNLLGLIPITFTPKAPPPLTIPVLFFTDVTVVQAAQFGGNLTIPGMRVLPGQSA